VGRIGTRPTGPPTIGRPRFGIVVIDDRLSLRSVPRARQERQADLAQILPRRLEPAHLGVTICLAEEAGIVSVTTRPPPDRTGGCLRRVRSARRLSSRNSTVGIYEPRPRGCIRGDRWRYRQRMDRARPPPRQGTACEASPTDQWLDDPQQRAVEDAELAPAGRPAGCGAGRGGVAVSMVNARLDTFTWMGWDTKLRSFVITPRRKPLDPLSRLAEAQAATVMTWPR